MKTAPLFTFSLFLFLAAIALTPSMANVSAGRETGAPAKLQPELFSSEDERTYWNFFAADREEDAFDQCEKIVERLLDASGQNKAYDEAKTYFYLRRYEVHADDLSWQRKAAGKITAWLDQPNLAPMVAARMHYARADMAYRISDRRLYEKSMASLAFVKDWVMVGPFDNERGAGYDIEYGPETEFSPEKDYQGKRGKVTWRESHLMRYDGYVDADAMFVPSDQGLSYFTTFIEVRSFRNCVLALSHDEAVKVYLNGLQLGASDVATEANFDLLYVTLPLREGVNRLTIKLCEQDGGWGFKARICDPDTLLAPRGLKVYASLDARHEESGLQVADGHETYGSYVHEFRNAFELDRGNFEAGFYYGALMLLDKPYDKASTVVRDHFEKMRAQFPESALAQYFFALASDMPSDMAAERDDNGRFQALMKTIELMPEFVVAHIDLAFHSLERGMYSRMRDHLTRIEEYNPESIRGRAVTAIYFAATGDRAEYYVRLKALLADHPENVLALEIASEACSNLGFESEALEMNRRLLSLDRTNSAVRHSLIERALAQANNESFRSLLSEELACNPFSTWAITQEAEYLAASFAETDVRSAIGRIREALEICPDDTELLNLVGEYYSILGDEESLAISRTYFDQSLVVDPSQAGIRRRQEFLSEGGVTFDQAFAEDFSELIETARAKFEAGEFDATDRTVTVLKREIVKLGIDASSETFHHYIYIIPGERGARETRNLYAGRGWGGESRILSARVIHGDGTESQPQISGWGSITLPRLSPGDVIEYTARSVEGPPDFFGDYYGATIYFGDATPTLRQDYILIAPKEKTFAVYEREFAGESAVIEEEDAKVYRWTARNLPKIQPEPLMPSRDEILPLIKVSSYATWDEFARWYHNLIQRQFESSPEIQNIVRDITAGLSDEYEKVRAIFNWVVTEIRYEAWEFGVHGYKPYQAQTICSRRFGDCKDKAILLCVMLKEIGVKGEMVLIYAETSRSDYEMALPQIGLFNHAICRVELSDGRVFFADGTAQFHGLTEVPEMDKGARVLVISAEGGRLENVPVAPAGENRLAISGELQIEATGAVGGALILEAAGSTSGSIRSNFEVPDQRARMLGEIVSAASAGARIENVLASDFENLNENPRMNFDVAVPGYATSESGGKLSVPLVFEPFALDLSRTALLEERKFDVILIPPRGIEKTIAYKLPEGYVFDLVPEDVKIETEDLYFEVTSTRDGNRLTVHCVFELRSNRVTVARYPEYRRAVHEIDQAMQARFRLKSAG
ncbi:MAG: DUF3857 domain-containing protein [Planctomycetes bacterium]|nr:DUF3857 domain-containing protein [Planctomycetota bacterium]